jgi:flagellar basal-body rod protein FlgC
MSSAISSAVSGLHAASMRVEASASNIANSRNSIPLDEARVADPPPQRPQSDPRPRPPVYEPVRVHQESVPGGGTRAEFAPVEAPHVKVYAPNDRLADKDGMIARPNVDYASEVVNMNQAEHAYKANLKVIATENAMIGALLNEQH